MRDPLRRLFVIAAVGGVGYAGWLVWQGRRDSHGAAEAPTWPPLDPPADAQINPATWVEPVDGACPDGFPIKANDNSGIYHVPGGRFYVRTAPERCYVDTEAAEADGYRAAKA